MSSDLTQKDFGTPQPIVPALYLVATPIGNLRDITVRALDVLAGVDVIYCEDTRQTGKLLQAYGIKTKLSVYNDYSKESVRDKIIHTIQSGQAAALVSDAGMPLISDPGYKLVRDCIEKGVRVTSCPGANAALMGVQLSGLPSDVFTFHGFLPTKSAARHRYLKSWAGVSGTHVFYESGNRVAACLRDAREVWGDRPAAIARELTKKFEEVKTGALTSLLSGLSEKGVKGEVVLVIGGKEGSDFSEEEIESLLRKALLKLSVKDAAAQVAEQTGQPKKKLYQKLLDMQDGQK